MNAPFTWEIIDVRDLGQDSNPRFKIDLEQNSKALEAYDLPEVKFNEIEKIVGRIQRGSFTSADAASVGKQLGELLFRDAAGGKLSQEAMASTKAVRFRAAAKRPKALRALLRWPWEMAVANWNESSPPLLERSLAHLPCARLVDGVAWPDASLERPRLLWGLTYPVDNPDLQVSPKDFEIAFAALQKRFPALDVRKSLTKDLDLGTLRVDIQKHAPHILVLLAHGKRVDDGPQILFKDGWHPVAKFAADVQHGRKVRVILLICCDLASGSTDDTGYGGASALVAEGAEAVVAMQGRILASDAADFLHALLLNSFDLKSLDEAVALARSAMKSDDRVAFLPTLFANNAIQGAVEGPRGVIKAYREGLQQCFNYLPKPRFYFERSKLEKSLRCRMESTGCLVLTGPIGVGTTQLVRKVLSTSDTTGTKGFLRPFIYIDFNEIDRTDEPVASLRSRFVERFQSQKELVGLHSDKPVAILNGADLAEKIHQAKITLILDHMPAELSDEEEQFWEEYFIETAKESNSGGLTVTINPPRKILYGNESSMEVGPLDAAQCAEFVNSHLPLWRLWADQITDSTKGSLALLDLWRVKYDAARPENMNVEDMIKDEGFTRQYIRLATNALDDHEFSGFSVLTRIVGTYDLQMAKDHLLRAVPKVTERLERLGLIVQVAGEERYYNPPWTRNAFESEFPDEISRANGIIVDSFVRRNPQEAIQELFAAPGGRPVLKAIQRASLEAGENELAKAIVLSANTGAASTDLLDLFDALDQRDPALLNITERLQVVQISVNLGLKRAKADLAKIKPDQIASDFLRARYLKLKAEILKDEEQARAVDEITQIYDEAIQLAQSHVAASADAKAVPADENWAELLSGLLQDYLSFHLFLIHRALKEVDAVVEQIRTLEGESGGYANALGACAEFEMKLPPDQIDWNRVARRLLTALEILKDSTNARYKVYITYQYAQYLRKNPNPVLEGAFDFYTQSAGLARQAGEPRREGLAVLRRVELGWKQLERLDVLTARAELDHVIQKLEGQQFDALTLRVLTNLYLLRGDLAKEAEDESSGPFYETACRTAGADVLQAQSDIALFKQALRAWLSGLRAKNLVVEAQKTLRSLEKAIELKLTLSVDYQDPWSLLEKLKHSP